MSEFKGTPGRFFAQSEEMESGDVSVCVCDQYGNSIAFCGRSLGLPERNAELFAAAPELLEALQGALHAHDKHGEHSEWDFARAAIAKALGQ